MNSFFTKPFLKVVLFFVLTSVLTTCATTQKTSNDSFDPIAYVDPMLGTNSGNVFGGVSLPFSMMRLGPDVQPNNMTNGYRTTKPIKGFSHTHLSGTGGGPRYGNFLVIPQVGDVDIEDFVSLKKQNESSNLGHYRVTLKRKPGDVKVNLTSTEHVGYHDYEFYKWGKHESLDANILIDVSAGNSRGKATDHRCLDGDVKIVSDSELSGWASFSGGWGAETPYTVYFHAVFDTPFEQFGVWEKGKIFEQEKQRVKSDSAFSKFGAYARFKTKQNQHIQLKVGISFLSEQKAKQNLDDEIPHWDFEKVKKEAETTWTDYLGAIEVKGGSVTDRKQFYSMLRNTLVMPTNVTGENPHWESEQPHFWEHYCLWDVFRTVMPLHTLLYPGHQRDVLNSMLSTYENKGWLPDAWIAGHYAQMQGGTNADVVFADAIAKGLGGFDEQKAYEAILKNASVPSENPKIFGRYLTAYQQLGYVLPSESSGSVSRTVEYAYNDFCISRVAEKLGEQKTASELLNRSKKVLNLFYKEKGYFWAKDEAGNWLPNFSLEPSRRDHWNDPYFYEGGSRNYSDFVPHAMGSLIELHGGNEAYEAHLDEIFNDGFSPSNEQVFLLPYLYHYIGKPSKTAERISAVLKNSYSLGESGLPGQDDSGAVSSWYVWSAMGLYPQAGQDIYFVTAPVFDEISLKVWDGVFRIKVERESPSSKYISYMSLDGKTMNRAFLYHQEIVKGGTLTLQLKDKPDDSWVSEVPPSF